MQLHYEIIPWNDLPCICVASFSLDPDSDWVLRGGGVWKGPKRESWSSPPQERWNSKGQRRQSRWEMHGQGRSSEDARRVRFPMQIRARWRRNLRPLQWVLLLRPEPASDTARHALYQQHLWWEDACHSSYRRLSSERKCFIFPPEEKYREPNGVAKEVQYPVTLKIWKISLWFLAWAISIRFYLTAVFFLTVSIHGLHFII